MADGDDSEAGGGDKARAFSADHLAAVVAHMPVRAQEFGDGELERLLRIWIEFHQETVTLADKRNKERAARRFAARDQWRDELDDLLKGLTITVSAAQALYQSGGVDLITEKFLKEEHYDPSEGILGSRAFDRAGDELATFYRALKRFHGAALQARQRLSEPTGRPIERYRLSALTELAELYAAAAGELPGASSQGPWAKFARAAAKLAWAKPRALTGHICDAARTVQRQAQFEVEQKRTTGITSLLHSARSIPWFVAYHRGSLPNTGAGA
jgi:hypothetical protein